MTERHYRYLTEIRTEAGELLMSAWFDTMADAMNWLANQREAYFNIGYLWLYLDSHPQLAWSF